MKILSVYDKEFREYGKIVKGVDNEELLRALALSPLPDSGTIYEPSFAPLEETEAAKLIASHVYGEMPVQLGYCNGNNSKLNCLEYHRDSELNLGTTDFILLLAKRSDIEGGILDTNKVKAFAVPKGVLVEVFASSMHYAPCGKNFRVLIVLPKGTNLPIEKKEERVDEDPYLWASNKWLYAHKDSVEAGQGAKVALVGNNIDLNDNR